MVSWSVCCVVVSDGCRSWLLTAPSSQTSKIAPCTYVCLSVCLSACLCVCLCVCVYSLKKSLSQVQRGCLGQNETVCLRKFWILGLKAVHFPVAFMPVSPKCWGLVPLTVVPPLWFTCGTSCHCHRFLQKGSAHTHVFYVVYTGCVSDCSLGTLVSGNIKFMRMFAEVQWRRGLSNALVWFRCLYLHYLLICTSQKCDVKVYK